MQECRGAATPLEPGLKLSKIMPSDQLDEKRKTAYRELIGSLMYIALRSRPDILFAVTKLSQFNSCPSETHWIQAKHVLRYLSRTVDYVIRYNTNEKPEIRIFCDADWAGDQDDRHSFTGMVVMIGPNIVQWISSKQKCISMSTMEAEYVALASAVKEAKWLKMLLSELKLYDSLLGISNVYCDNKSAIEFSKSRVENSRTKHIDIAYHVVREELEKKSIRLSYVSSNENVADIMTKNLKCIAHKNCTERLGIAKVGD
ncbi:secreted RxLR effector protein 161-like [Osmia bicornis bicornis]|uniref:secreted RxLR effector protein 161-like n=1 Tax=Osmia bicornis bicornis TaxID=1437191 RepID=UPI001EAE940E|nr:secreted RxLR effector protein 161-like [Osmia bicornis bicornis]